MRTSIVLVAALILLAAHRPETATLRLAPYERLPEDVRAGVLDAISDACSAAPATARKEAATFRVIRADLDGDGIDDYVMDEWSGHCFRNPAHYVHVWRGTRHGRHEWEEHAEASLLRGARGFAWVQTRCHRSDNRDFQIESYRRGKIVPSRCYPAKKLESELRRRGLTDPFPR